jgi:nucleoid DNA-binding protein
MTYKDLVTELGKRTGFSDYIIKDILFALPDALLALRAGDQVRTPLGVFRMMTRRGRFVTPPFPGSRAVAVPPERVIKLRPGIRLRK